MSSGKKKKKVAFFLENAIIFRLREEYKYHKGMQTLQLQSRLVPYFDNHGFSWSHWVCTNSLQQTAKS